MSRSQIIKRCIEKLGMSPADAAWVADNLYTYECPDFSEWSWSQIDQCFRDVLFFMGKSNADVLRSLGVAA